MFLNLNHYNLDVFKAARDLRLNAYQILRKLPDSEKYNLIDQMRRASTSIVLNISKVHPENQKQKETDIMKWQEVL